MQDIHDHRLAHTPSNWKLQTSVLRIRPQITTLSTGTFSSLPLRHALQPPLPSTFFRRLTQDEVEQFQENLASLEKLAQSYPSQVSSPLFVEHITALCKRISLAFHNIKRPAREHQDTFMTLPSTLPKGGERRKAILRELQTLSDSWKAKLAKKRKKRLHSSPTTELPSCPIWWVLRHGVDPYRYVAG